MFPNTVSDHPFSEDEVPTRPFLTRPQLPLAPAMAPFRLMLVSSPGLPLRGLAWARRSVGTDFEGRDLQRIVCLERLNLG